MKRSEILEGAAEAIETYGWIRYNNGNVNVGFCLSGAMVHAIYENGKSLKRLIPTALLAPVFPERYRYSVSLYNDSVLRNGREAVDILIKGAKYWRDRGE